MEQDMSTCVQASNLKAQDVRRADSGFPEMDWLWGSSIIGGKTVWGLPEGGITLLGGEEGVGKSRLAIEIAKKQIAGGLKVLYMQTEIDLRSFRRWVKGATNLHLLYCSDAKTLQDQIDTIKAIKPHLVLIDSVNEIEEYNSGATRDIRTVVSSFREITNSMSLHIMFIVQLNKNGTIKGSSTLPHLIDTVMKAKKLGGDEFVVELGKHRFGRTGENYWCRWRHTDAGVECVSKYRYEDKAWARAHGYSGPMKVYRNGEKVNLDKTRAEKIEIVKRKRWWIF
jgi:DNA repair protein RadA/Sms